MIRIIINKQEVYLDPKTTLRFDLVHPAFESEYLYASMIYPFDIPAHKNETIFSHSNHIVVNKKFRIYDCEFIFSDAINFTGKLVLSKLSRTSFRGSIIFNGFSIDSKDILLKDFTFDDDVSLGATTAAVAAYVEGVVDDAYPTVNFNFPNIEAPLWYGSDREHNPDFGDYLNGWIRQSQSIYVNSINEDPPDSVNSILPCLYLMYVIKSCFADLGFKIFGDFLTHEELSQLIIFYNSPLDLTENKYTVKAEHKADQPTLDLTPLQLKFDDDYNPPNQDPDDCWSVAQREYTIQKEGYHDFIVTGQYRINQTSPEYEHIVHCKIRDETASETLASFDPDPCIYGVDTDFIIDGSNIWIPASKIGHKIIVTGNAVHIEGSTPWPSLITFKNMLLDVKNTSFCKLNSFKKTLHYADHLPEISFGKLITAISQAFGLFLLFDHENRIIEIEFLQSLLDNPNFLDLSNNYIEGSYEILLKESEGYSYQFKWDGADYDEEEYYTEFNPDKYIGEFDSVQDLYIPNDLNVFAFIKNINAIYYYHVVQVTGVSRWDKYSFYFPPFISSPVKSDIQVSFSPLMLLYDGNDDSIYPYTLIKGSSPSYPTGINKCDLHLLFYRGLGTEDDAYPFATPFAYDRYGSQEWENELRFDGDNGLMEKFLSSWLEFLKDSQEVSMDFDLNLEDLRKVMQLFLPQTGTKIRKILVHNTEYIPKKLSIMLTMKGIRSCQGKLIKKGMIGI